MAGRLSNTKAKLVNGKCLNYACDVKLNCGLYDKTPTTEQRENYPAMSMEQCPLFVDNDPPIPRDKEPERPFMEAYGGGNFVREPGGIYGLDDLQKMNNNLSGNYKLMNDIDASATSGWNGGLGFEPIGDITTRFTGNFDGGNYTIDGLFINRPLENYVGLFGATKDGEIKDTHLTGVDITGGQYVGGFVGNPEGVTNILSDCSVTGVIDGDSSVGGFTGYGCVSTFNRCWANVDVTCNSGGGGFTSGGGHYNNCYALGDVAGGITSGGFCGWISGTYTNCYSVGQVNGGADVGIGFSVGALGTFTNCFWDMDTSGQSTSGGSATGKTTVNMYKEATFTNWNFVTVWQIVEDTSYPTLR